MEDEAAEAERQKEEKRTAIRERVRKHRAAKNSPPTMPRASPMSNRERVRKHRLKKLHERQASSSIQNQDAVGSDDIWARKTPSAERTRKYRQHLRERSRYIKEIPLGKSERNRRYYPKVQQAKLHTQIAEASGIQVRGFAK